MYKVSASPWEKENMNGAKDEAPKGLKRLRVGWGGLGDRGVPEPSCSVWD